MKLSDPSAGVPMIPPQALARRRRHTLPRPRLKLTRHAQLRLLDRSIPQMMVAMVRSYGHIETCPDRTLRRQLSAHGAIQLGADIASYLSCPRPRNGRPSAKLRSALIYFGELDARVAERHEFAVTVPDQVLAGLRQILADLDRLQSVAVIEARDGSVVTAFSSADNGKVDA